MHKVLQQIKNIDGTLCYELNLYTLKINGIFIIVVMRMINEYSENHVMIIFVLSLFQCLIDVKCKIIFNTNCK